MNPRGAAFAHLVAGKRPRDPGSRLLRAILGEAGRTSIDTAAPPVPSPRPAALAASAPFKSLVSSDACDALKSMKARLARISRPVRKAELVHAGIDLLASLSDDELLAVLDRAARARHGRDRR